MSGPILDQLLQTYLEPILSSRADVLGLSCTHYPFLRPKIEAILRDRVQVYDSNIPVALRVRAVLRDADALADQPARVHQFFTTRDPGHFSAVVGPLPGVPPHTISRAFVLTPVSAAN
jgi:glutamate racemase